MSGEAATAAGAENRALKGYAPLVVLVAALIAMVAVVPSQVPAERGGLRRRGRRRGRRGAAGDRLGRPR